MVCFEDCFLSKNRSFSSVNYKLRFPTDPGHNLSKNKSLREIAVGNGEERNVKKKEREGGGGKVLESKWRR